MLWCKEVRDMYKKYLSMHIKSSFEYRLNMIFIAFTQVLISVGEVISIFLLFKKFNSVGTWGFYEVAFMFGVVTSTFSIAECFGRGFDDFSSLIKHGQLDRFLVRPVNLKYQILCSKIEFSKMGRVILGLVVSIIALSHINISWTFWKVLVLLGMYLCGVLVFFGTMVIGAGVSVFSVENLEVINIITNGSKEIAFYPLNVYKKWLTRIFTYILPVSCFNYLPVTYLLKGSTVSPIYAIAPFLGCLFVIPCLLFFDWSISKYQGAGS